MKCPYCGNVSSKVTDSRPTEGYDAIRRRRQCLECGKRFTTFERVEERPLTVIKKDGGREPYNRQKLLDGLRRATVKRQISSDQLDQLVADIEADLRNQFLDEVTATKLGEMVLARLRRLDKVAYVRFASVYREFQDVDEFTSTLTKLQPSYKRKSQRANRKKKS